VLRKAKARAYRLVADEYLIRRDPWRAAWWMVRARALGPQQGVAEFNGHVRYQARRRLGRTFDALRPGRRRR
jgi:hypothetical protein